MQSCLTGTKNSWIEGYVDLVVSIFMKMKPVFANDSTHAWETYVHILFINTTNALMLIRLAGKIEKIITSFPTGKIEKIINNNQFVT